MIRWLPIVFSTNLVQSQQLATCAIVWKPFKLISIWKDAHGSMFWSPHTKACAQRHMLDGVVVILPSFFWLIDPITSFVNVQFFLRLCHKDFVFFSPIFLSTMANTGYTAIIMTLTLLSAWVQSRKPSAPLNTHRALQPSSGGHNATRGSHYPQYLIASVQTL